MTKWPSEYLFFITIRFLTQVKLQEGVKSKYLSGAKLEALHFSSLGKSFCLPFFAAFSKENLSGGKQLKMKSVIFKVDVLAGPVVLRDQIRNVKILPNFDN